MLLDCKGNYGCSGVDAASPSCAQIQHRRIFSGLAGNSGEILPIGYLQLEHRLRLKGKRGERSTACTGSGGSGALASQLVKIFQTGDNNNDVHYYHFNQHHYPYDL